MGQISFFDGAPCNTVSIWYRIWNNVAQITFGEINNKKFSRPYWATRPINPNSFDHTITGINRYNSDATKLMVGEKVIIELDTVEKDLMGYIHFLLGAGPTTFNWQWGDHNGNVREPHLTQKTPVGLNYGFLIRDNFNNAPPGIPIDLAISYAWFGA